MLKEVDNLTPHIATAKSPDTLFGGYQNFYAHGKLVVIKPKRLARQAFCSVPNGRRACACPKSQFELLFFS